MVAALAALRERRDRSSSHRQLGGLRRAERAQAKEIGKKNLRERLLELVLDPATQQHRPAVWCCRKRDARPGRTRWQTDMGAAGRELGPGDCQPSSAFLDDGAGEASRQPHGHVAGEGKGKIEEPGSLRFGGENFTHLRVAERDDAAILFVDADLQPVECDLPCSGVTAREQRRQQH